MGWCALFPHKLRQFWLLLALLIAVCKPQVTFLLLLPHQHRPHVGTFVHRRVRSQLWPECAGITQACNGVNTSRRRCTGPAPHLHVHVRAVVSQRRFKQPV